MSYWLIIATSGRMLAQAAWYEGYNVLVIDCYADVDTLKYAEKVVRANSFSIKNLITALDSLKTYAITGIVYGSGFETFPESLHFLQHRFSLSGNLPNVFEKVQNKKTFFTALAFLEIPYPETQFNYPDLCDSKTWLSKPLNGQGGIGISFNHSNKPDSYWQRYYDGQAGSVLFLATKENVTVFGFHRQWTHATDENEFLFAGICHDDDIAKIYRERIANWLQKLVDYFDLRGLNSLDFIQTETDIFVLEINPRPSASMQLYDAPLFSMHIQANLLP